MSKNVGRQEIIELAKQLATPIDFLGLEKEGIIEKKGAWFMVKSLKDLPEYVSMQVRSIKTDDKGNCFVQFPKSWKRAQRFYRRMTGKEYNE